MDVVKVTRHGTLTGYNTDRCRCDECRQAYRDYRTANKDRIKARMAQYYIDNKDRINARNLAYYHANREDQLAKAAERYRQDLEQSRRLSRERMARWRVTNPGNPWRDANPERDRENNRKRAQRPEAKAYQRQWAEANRDRFTEYNRRWRESNPAAAKARDARNRLLREMAEVCEISDRDWLRLCDRHDNRCAYCRDADSPLTQDHVVPISRGGRHAIGNLLPACQSCNSSKNASTIVEWKLRR